MFKIFYSGQCVQWVLPTPPCPPAGYLIGQTGPKILIFYGAMGYGLLYHSYELIKVLYSPNVFVSLRKG